MVLECVPAVNFSVTTVSSFNAMTGSTLELIGCAFTIGDCIGRSVASLLASHFIGHVGTVWIAIAPPFDRQTGTIAASVLRRRTSSSQQGGTVAFVGSAVTVRVSVTNPHLRNAVAIVRAPKRAARAIPAGFC